MYVTLMSLILPVSGDVSLVVLMVATEPLWKKERDFTNFTVPVAKLILV